MGQPVISRVPLLESPTWVLETAEDMASLWSPPLQIVVKLSGSGQATRRPLSVLSEGSRRDDSLLT